MNVGDSQMQILRTDSENGERREGRLKNNNNNIKRRQK